MDRIAAMILLLGAFVVSDIILPYAKTPSIVMAAYDYD